jgi:hypothetical protein
MVPIVWFGVDGGEPWRLTRYASGPLDVNDVVKVENAIPCYTCKEVSDPTISHQ